MSPKIHPSSMQRILETFQKYAQLLNLQSSRTQLPPPPLFFPFCFLETTIESFIGFTLYSCKFTIPFGLDLFIPLTTYQLRILKHYTATSAHKAFGVCKVLIQLVNQTTRGHLETTPTPLRRREFSRHHSKSGTAHRR